MYFDDDTSQNSSTHGAEAWLDENGRPTRDYLESLAHDPNPEAIEELRGIADDHDVPYSRDTSAQELIDAILLALEEEGGGHEAVS